MSFRALAPEEPPAPMAIRIVSDVVIVHVPAWTAEQAGVLARDCASVSCAAGSEHPGCTDRQHAQFVELRDVIVLIFDPEFEREEHKLGTDSVADIRARFV